MFTYILLCGGGLTQTAGSIALDAALPISVSALSEAPRVSGEKGGANADGAEVRVWRSGLTPAPTTAVLDTTMPNTVSAITAHLNSKREGRSADGTRAGGW